jgi:DNA-binding CsgD family transcriptional regulator
MSSILLRPSCPPEDDPDIRRLLELVAAASGASFVELELAAPDGETRRYRRGKPIAESSSHPLELRHHRALLRLGSAGRQPGPPPELVAFALDGILQRLHFSAQLSVLLAGMETSTSGVLLFDRGGEVVYANPRAKALLPQPTEGGPDGELPGQRLQTVFERVRSMAKQLVDGRAAQRAWNSLLVLSDSSVLGCEVVRIGGEAGVSGVAVASLLQPLTTLPNLFVDAFCARYGVSPRERELIGLLLEGRGTSEMASRLSISEYTVRDHLKRLYRKTGTRSRSELVSVVSTARMEPAGDAHRR